MENEEARAILLSKSYDGQSLYDATRDFAECFDASFNPIVDAIPTDEYGFQKGTFRVTVEWSPEE